MIQKPVTEDLHKKDDPTLKYLKIILFAVILTMISIGALAAYYAFFNGNDISLFDSGSCEQDGVKYANGETVPSKDNCNTCSCDNGEIACTLMWCEDYVPPDNPTPEDNESEDGGTSIPLSPPVGEFEFKDASITCTEKDVGVIRMDTKIPKDAVLSVETSPSDCFFMIDYEGSQLRVNADVGIYFPWSTEEYISIGMGSGEEMIRIRTGIDSELCENYLGTEYRYQTCGSYRYGYYEGDNSCYQSTAEECIISPKAGKYLVSDGVYEFDNIQISESVLHLQEPDIDSFEMIDIFDEIVLNTKLIKQ